MAIGLGDGTGASRDGDCNSGSNGGGDHRSDGDNGVDGLVMGTVMAEVWL